MGEVIIDKLALLITGTLVPNSNFVANFNLVTRRQEYIDALLFYSFHFPNNDIFFLENSSYNFSEDEINSLVEYLKYVNSTAITYKGQRP